MDAECTNMKLFSYKELCLQKRDKVLYQFDHDDEDDYCGKPTKGASVGFRDVAQHGNIIKPKPLPTNNTDVQQKDFLQLG